MSDKCRLVGTIKVHGSLEGISDDEFEKLGDDVIEVDGWYTNDGEMHGSGDGEVIVTHRDGYETSYNCYHCNCCYSPFSHFPKRSPKEYQIPEKFIDRNEKLKNKFESISKECSFVQEVLPKLIDPEGKARMQDRLTKLLSEKNYLYNLMERYLL